MIRNLVCFMVIVFIVFSALGPPAGAQRVTEDAEEEPEHIRGQIIAIEASSVVVKTGDGVEVRLRLPKDTTVLKLSKASFTDVDFGAYVGSVSKRLDAYSPIVRDSMSWLHLGYELRIFDEQLRGLALGHRKWDLTPVSVMTHGWVDDLEIRVLSIKYGPTEEEETDVDIPRNAPISRLSLGDQRMIKPGMVVFAGAQKAADGNYGAVFLIVGDEGTAPEL